MDRFIAWSAAAGLVMSYYDATNIPEGTLARRTITVRLAAARCAWFAAQQFTLLHNYFHSAFGGSFLNHQCLICACAPTWPDTPAGIVAQVDANGRLTKDGQVAPVGFAVNTSSSINSPHPDNITDKTQLVPDQTAPTIGDRLSDRVATSNLLEVRFCCVNCAELPLTWVQWGPGSGVPAIIISSFAKKNFVDHAQYDTRGILKLIEERWGHKPLNQLDANAGGLLTAFDFAQN